MSTAIITLEETGFIEQSPATKRYRHGPSALMSVETAQMDKFTAKTITAAAELAARVHTLRGTGISRSDRGFEDDISSLPAPIFDHTGQFAAAVSVASVATRFTPALEDCILGHLPLASREITRNWGGVTPDFIEAAWAASLSPANVLDPAT